MIYLKILVISICCYTVIVQGRKNGKFQVGVIGNETFPLIQNFTSISTNGTMESKNWSGVTIVNFDDVKRYSDQMKTDGIDVLIGEYSYGLSLIANDIGIPYYITANYPEKDSKWFIKMALQYSNLGAAISSSESPTNLNFIAINSKDLMDVLNLMEFDLMTFKKLLSSGDPTLKMNTSVLLKNGTTVTVIGVTDEEANNVDLVLDQLLRTDFMFNQTIWIPGFFNDSVAQKSIFKYAKTGARLKIFGNQTANLNSFKAYNLACALDGVKHYYAAVQNLTFFNDSLVLNVTNATVPWPQGDEFLDILMKPNNLSASATGEMNLMISTATPPNPVIRGLIRKAYYLLVMEPTVVNNVTQFVATTNITIVDQNITSEAIQKGQPVIIAMPEQADVTMTAFGKELMGNIFGTLKVRMKLQTFPERNIGVKKNNTWTGLISYLVSKKADIIGIPAIHSRGMNDVTVKSPVIFSGSLGMLAYKPEEKTSPFRILLPFSLVVWICVAVIVFFLIVVLFATNKISPNQGKSVDKLTWGNSSFVMFGSVVMAKLLVKPVMVSTRIFYLLVWFGTLILVASYAANLFAMQTASVQPTYPFRSLQELRDLLPEKEYQWGFIKDGAVTQLYNDISDNPNTTIVSLYNQMKEKWGDKNLLNSFDDVNLTLSNNKTFVFIDGNKQIQKLSYTYCNLKQPAFTIEEQIMYVFLMRKDWSLINDFSKLLQNLTDTGYIQTLADKYLNTGKCASLTNVPTTKTAEMKLDQMLGLFIIVAIGFVLALIAVIVEAIFYCLRVACIRRKRRPKFQFGAVYNGTVKAIKEDGIQVSLQPKSLGAVLVENQFLSKTIGKDFSPEAAGFPLGAQIKVKYIGNDPRTARMRFRPVKKK